MQSKSGGGFINASFKDIDLLLAVERSIGELLERCLEVNKEPGAYNSRIKAAEGEALGDTARWLREKNRWEAVGTIGWNTTCSWRSRLSAIHGRLTRESIRDRSRWVNGNLASSGICRASMSVGCNPMYLNWGVAKCSISSRFYKKRGFNVNAFRIKKCDGKYRLRTVFTWLPNRYTAWIENPWGSASTNAKGGSCSSSTILRKKRRVLTSG